MIDAVSWWQVLVALGVSLLAVYAALLVALLAVRPRGVSLNDAARLLPDVLRLLRRLGSDRDVPASLRAWLWFLLAYLALPIDIVPDVVPVLGYADDVLVTLLVLRAVVRRVGVPVLEQHWPGTPERLRAVLLLAGCSDDGGSPPDRCTDRPSRHGGGEAGRDAEDDVDQGEPARPLLDECDRLEREGAERRERPREPGPRDRDELDPGGTEGGGR